MRRTMDGLARALRVDAAHEAHVELDEVGLEVGEQVQAGVAGADVVDCRQEADAPVLAQDLRQPLAVVDLFAFDRLEDDALDREAVRARRVQRGADAQLGRVYGVGQEGDRQPAGQVQRGSGLDGLDAAGLVEAVAVVVVDLGQHAVGRLALRAAHQRLVHEDLARAHVDDGLEGEAEAKRQTVRTGAIDAPRFVAERRGCRRRGSQGRGHRRCLVQGWGARHRRPCAPYRRAQARLERADSAVRRGDGVCGG
jgi:hypothetical protein